MEGQFKVETLAKQNQNYSGKSLKYVPNLVHILGEPIHKEIANLIIEKKGISIECEQ